MTASFLAAPARLLAAVLSLLVLASCSGGVSGPAPVNDPTRITILPATATLYSGVPTTFVISGGTGSYIVSSSNQAVVPVSGSINGNSLTVVPNAVGSETAVALTVRDTGTTPVATATLNVRPGTVSNEIAITPSLTQGLNCSPAVCSGGDAEVVAMLSQAGVPISGRSVRLDVVTGDFRFITSVPGSSSETLATTTSVATDQTGAARARIRALPGAANQTALLQVTDSTSGSFQRASFAISQATGTSPGFFASPSSITFQGRRQGECAGTDIAGTFYVFGGTAPYTVSNTISTLIVRPELVTSSGAGFSVTPTGGCIAAPGVPIVIRDAAGRTFSVNVANIPGTEVIPALSASPSTVNLSSCDATASVQVAGGRSGTYFVASGSDALIATISGSTVTIRRRNPSGPGAASGTIGISDGTSVVSVQVTLSGAALGACPSPQFTATPTAVTLSDCVSSAQVFLSGGSGTYTAVSSSASISATVSGSVLSIRRSVPSGSLTGGNVTVSDGSTSLSIAVNTTGAGAGSCGTGQNTLALNPTSITLSDCSSTSFVDISGGSGSYNATPSNSSLLVAVNGRTLSVRRANPSGAFGGGSVTISDGSGASVTLTVNAAGEAAGPCPTPLSVSPSVVTLTDCTTASLVTVSGGSGGVRTATSTSSSISADLNFTGNVLSIRRRTSSGFSGGTVTVSDGTSTANITVNATGEGADACPTTTPFAASPTSVTLSDCTGVVQVTLSGGSGNYSAATQSSQLSVSIPFGSNVVSIRRSNNSGAFAGGTVTASDGSTNITITVNATGSGAGICPTPITASPSSVTLNDCGTAAQVTLSGGSGTYTASTSSAQLSLSQSGSTLFIRRALNSGVFTGATVNVTDGTVSTTISVSGSGSGAGACAPLAAQPQSITLTDCTTAQQVSLSGGSGSYTVVSQPAQVIATISGSVLSIRRSSNSGTFGGGAVTVSDGASSVSIAVNASGSGSGACTGTPLSVSPQSVTLTDCTTAQQVSITGGSGNYVVTSQPSQVVATLSGGVLSIRRSANSASFGGGSVTVSDGSTSVSVNVNASGAGAGACQTTISASPSSAELTSCSDTPSVVLSGGNGNYLASTSNSGIFARINGNILQVGRNVGTGPIPSSNSVTVTDTANNPGLVVPVSAIGGGAGPC